MDCIFSEKKPVWARFWEGFGYQKRALLVAPISGPQEHFTLEKPPEKRSFFQSPMSVQVLVFFWFFIRFFFWFFFAPVANLFWS